MLCIHLLPSLLLFGYLSSSIQGNPTGGSDSYGTDGMIQFKGSSFNCLPCKGKDGNYVASPFDGYNNCICTNGKVGGCSKLGVETPYPNCEAFAGVCENRMCPAVYRPVCGADGKTYANVCEACGVRITCNRECPCHGPDSFKCADGKRIKKAYQCDGELDCLDGSDEIKEDCGRLSCAFNTTYRAMIWGHGEGGSFSFYNDYSPESWTDLPSGWTQCRDRCCRDEKCKSFDYRQNEGPNCKIAYVTKDEAPNSFRTLSDNSGEWEYNEMVTGELELVGEGQMCGSHTLKRCGPGLYCTSKNQDYMGSCQVKY